MIDKNTLRKLSSVSGRVSEAFRSIYLNRYHQLGDKSQTVGEHTMGMLLTLFLVHPDPSVELIKAVAFHDVPENVTGDTPYPFKKLVEPQLHEIEREYLEAMLGHDTPPLTPDEQNWLAVLDKFECHMYASYRIARGDNFYKPVVKNVRKALLEMDEAGKIPSAFLEFMRELGWEDTDCDDPNCPVHDASGGRTMAQALEQIRDYLRAKGYTILDEEPETPNKGTVN